MLIFLSRLILFFSLSLERKWERQYVSDSITDRLIHTSPLWVLRSRVRLIKKADRDGGKIANQLRFDNSFFFLFFFLSLLLSICLNFSLLNKYAKLRFWIQRDRLYVCMQTNWQRWFLKLRSICFVIFVRYFLPFVFFLVFCFFFVSFFFLISFNKAGYTATKVACGWAGAKQLRYVSTFVSNWFLGSLALLLLPKW